MQQSYVETLGKFAGASFSIKKILALHAPFHHLQPVVFGLMEKDVLCTTMTITVGVNLVFSWGVSF